MGRVGPIPILPLVSFNSYQPANLNHNLLCEDKNKIKITDVDKEFYVCNKISKLVAPTKPICSTAKYFPL